MGASFNNEDDEPISEINIVPFVDIILVVLIIFMVTTPFIMKPSLPVNLPKGSSGDKTAPSAFQVLVGKNGQIALNGKLLNIEELKIASRAFSSENPTGKAILSADQETPHGDVMRVLDEIKLGGIRSFGISIKSN